MIKRLLVDKNICTGCRYCEIICSLVHENVINPQKARIRVFRDVLNGIDSPVVCRQCAKPPCMEACIIGAIEIDKKLGIPRIDSKKCTGCLKCVGVCPFQAMFFDFQKNVAIKCDLCGGDPQCVKFCRAIPHIGYSAISYATPYAWAKRRAE